MDWRTCCYGWWTFCCALRDITWHGMMGNALFATRMFVHSCRYDMYWHWQERRQLNRIDG
jgi:hypothetical protein